MFLQIFCGFLYISVAHSLATVQNHTAVACLQLKSTLGNRTFSPLQNGYSSLSTENWYVLSCMHVVHETGAKPFRSGTAWAKPTCIVQPADTSELQKAIRILTSRHVQFAIRSGGHMPSPLAANINKGVLIDMSMFNRVVYDAAQNVATVGVGMKWGEVYHQLDPYNVTVVGGRVLDVGVGGLILGSVSFSHHHFTEPLLISQVDCHIFPISMALLATMSSISR